jgi:transcriptional regulator with XRE-family HTH domain
MNEKLAFSQRLQAAMTQAGLEPRPAVLLELFNRQYWGKSVTFQAVSRWLKGQAIPNQDKLMTLAKTLRIEPDVLRFGSTLKLSVQEDQDTWHRNINYLERETFAAFLDLSTEHRKLIRELILAFSQLKQPHADQPIPSTPGN